MSSRTRSMPMTVVGPFSASVSTVSVCTSERSPAAMRVQAGHTRHARDIGPGQMRYGSPWPGASADATTAVQFTACASAVASVAPRGPGR